MATCEICGESQDTLVEVPVKELKLKQVLTRCCILVCDSCKTVIDSKDTLAEAINDIL